MKKNLYDGIRAISGLLIFIIPLFVLPIARDYFEFPKMFLFYFLVLLLVGLWVLLIIFEKKIFIKKISLWLPISLLLFVWILSTIFSIHPDTSLFGNPWRFNGGLLSIFAFIIFTFIVINTIDVKDINFYLKVALISTLSTALIGIMQAFKIIKFLPSDGRIGSTLGQANFLGSFLLIGIFISIYFVLTTQKTLKKFLSILFIYLPILYCLILTASRSAWLSLAIGILFFALFLLLFKFKKQFLVISLISIISFLAFFPILKQKYRIINLSPQGTIYSRIYAWKGAWEITKNNPILGTGPETFLYAMPKYRDARLNYNYENWTSRFDKAHNEFLNLLATTGFLGFLTFLYLLFVVFKNSLKLSKVTNDFQIKILVSSLLAGLISLIIAVSFGFLVVPTWFFFWVIIAILAILENKIIWQNQNFTFSPKFLKNKINQSIVLTFITALIILAGYFLGRICLAEIYFSHGNNLKATRLNSHLDIYLAALASEKHSPELAQKAINLNPLNPDNWGNYAQIETNYLKKKEAMLIAENLDPTNAQLFFELGQIAFNNDDLELAKKQLQKAIELKNDYQEAKNLLAQISR